MDNPNQNDNNVDQLDEVVYVEETNNKKSNSFLKVVLAFINMIFVISSISIILC